MVEDKNSISGKLQPGPNYNKITDEKEVVLKQIWTNLFHLWNVEVDGTNAFSDRRLTAYNTHSSTESEKKPKKKSSGGWFGFGSSSSTSSDATGGNEHDSMGINSYEKGVVHSSFDGLDAKLAEKVFWDMLRVDPPDSTIWRFSSARKFNSSKATKMIAHTIKFRSEHNMEQLLNKGDYDVFKNKEEGVILNFNLQKAVIVGRDLKERPFILVRPKFHHSHEQTEADIEKFALIVIEISRLYMRTGYTSIIFDLTDFSLSNMDYAPVKFLITCFEAHYPESLGCLLIHNAPWLFSPIWNIVKNWLDPVVASKIIFTKNLSELTKFIAKENIPKYLGGENDFDLDNYVPPDGSHDEALNDTAGKDAVLVLREQLIATYKELTVKWIETNDPEKSKEIWNQRVSIGQEITNNYCELDKFIRSSSYYDITGTLEI